MDCSSPDRQTTRNNNLTDCEIFLLSFLLLQRQVLSIIENMQIWTLEAHITCFKPVFPYLEPTLYPHSMTENLHHYFYHLDITHGIFVLRPKKSIFIFFYIRMSVCNDWNKNVFPSPLMGPSCVCCCVLSSLFLCLSETVAVSVCGRGKASFSKAHHSLRLIVQLNDCISATLIKSVNVWKCVCWQSVNLCAYLYMYVCQC